MTAYSMCVILLCVCCVIIISCIKYVKYIHMKKFENNNVGCEVLTAMTMKRVTI
jgi:hypothetical protein